ncbi:MAG: DUF2207 domain-containing protein [Clostridia bacterium]|nr:DUF2207 domain-containing protein [Clostridia bacterium]
MKRIMRNKGIKRASLIAVTILLVLTLAAPAAFALKAYEGEDDDLEAMVPTRQTDYFNVDIKVNENNTYNYTETVGFVFNTPGHGIFRNIPTTFDGISEKIDDGWCDTDNVEIYTEDGFFVLQMGDGDRYVNGKHEYKYGYTITMRDDRNTDGDYLYIDLLPVDWQTPIAKSDITIHMPKKISKKNVQVYGGGYSSTTLPDNISWDMDGNRTIKVSGENLDKGEGITLLVDLPEGYWVGAWSNDSAKTIAIILCLIFVAAFVLIWFRYGRKQDIVQTVEFHPPEGVTPAEIGLMIDGNLDKKDMVSMFMYFAQNGLMKITQKQKKNFEFEKLSEIRGEKRFAEVLFDGLFGEGAPVGTKVSTLDLGEDFGESYLAACDIVEDDFGNARDKTSEAIQRLAGYALYLLVIVVGICAVRYALRPESYMFGAFISGLACAFITGKQKKSYKNRMNGKKGKKSGRIIRWVIDGCLLAMTAVGFGSAFESGAAGFLFFATFGACQVLNVYYEKYSENAIKYMGKILGLREFIKTAELDQLNALVEENPEYYYDILPYAYVLGLTDKWAKKFENIPIPTPNWFIGADATNTMMGPMYMANCMNGLNTAAINAVGASMPRVSLGGGSDSGGGWSSGGGGGFSGGGGGGFSGGGAGGGGGGSW